jgi:hypothetical protein
MSLAAILVIIALVLIFLHAVLWRFVPTYRSPLMFHVAAFVGFLGTLFAFLHIAGS